MGNHETLHPPATTPPLHYAHTHPAEATQPHTAAAVFVTRARARAHTHTQSKHTQIFKKKKDNAAAT